MLPYFVYLRTVFLFAICFNLNKAQCIHNGTTMPNHFFHGDNEHFVTIGQSGRSGHRLVTEIFKILLKDVMGYTKVKIKDSDGTADENSIDKLRIMSRCQEPGNCSRKSSTPPEVMINLEVWLELDFNLNEWTSDNEIENCGSLGPIGRSAWYVPNYSVGYFWEANHIVLDHWRSFKDPQLASKFDLLEADNMLAGFTFDSYMNCTYCKDADCDEDCISRSPQCRGKAVRCATLLADYPDQASMALMKIIWKLELLVNIAWVGDKLENMVKDWTKELKNIMFFHKKPSSLVSLGNYTLVSMEQCGDGKCGNQLFEISKFAWIGIKSDAPNIHHLLKKFYFTEESYVRILRQYTEKSLAGATINDVACEWIRSHYFVWSYWLPRIDSTKPLYIGGIFPLSGAYWRQSSVVHAAQMAVDAVNRNISILPNYRLTLLMQDGQCVVEDVIKSFIHYTSDSILKRLIGILGPACTDTVESVAGVAKYFNTIIISYSAEGSLFNNRQRYPYFFRTVPDNNQFLFVYLKLFQQLKWNRIASLTEQGQEYSEYISHLQVLLQSHGVDFISSNRFPRQRTIVDIKSYLQDLKDKKARIIIGDFYDYAARSVMCAAFKLGMTARQGYQWFLPFWFRSDWYDTDQMNQESETERVPCTTVEMADAINGHLSLTFRPYANPEVLMQENITIKEWMHTYKRLADKDHEDVSQYGGYAYDAVWAYASALHILLAENYLHAATLHSKKTSRRFAELLNETKFSGVSGRLQFAGSSRLSEVIIWQWMKDSERREVGIYRPLSEYEGELLINETEILWLTANRKQPDDGSNGADNCSLEIFNTILNIGCDVVIGVVLVTVISIVTSLLTFGGIYIKRRYDRRIRRTEARMKQLGLMVNSKVLSLDGWQMSREQVVINRRLGAGAFGDVFGGETYIENDGWIAVAVKTLKSGAKSEEKLEFLSEAELMKKLQHPNIIKLIGVCTTVEPLYLVMEFMLYGDLKTFLLERRNLVTAPNRASNDDISDRRLTRMALDIAMGLNYLANRKYIHRDIACRNCLVNSNHTVKIADFGLCRKIYDSDYYRIRKKGLLPLRWMSPESIVDGIYTPMSDIWSFGIVVFEIITFGSFPYQCLSDREVIGFVSSCNTLNIPNGCKPEVEELLKRCWTVVPTERPLASDVIELLTSYPELLWPCLDEPMSSVEMNHTDSVSVSVHDSSLPWMWRTKRRQSAISEGKSSARSHDYPRAHAANAVKEDGKYGMELKEASLDISHSSYIFMGASNNPPKELGGFTLNYVYEVTHL